MRRHALGTNPSHPKTLALPAGFSLTETAMTEDESLPLSPLLPAREVVVNLVTNLLMDIGPGHRS
jgi:hypothetical protein